MIIQCPNCKNTLNVQGTIGTFVCTYCHISCRINPQNQPGSSPYPMQPQSQGYSGQVYNGASPAQYGNQAYGVQSPAVAYGSSPYGNAGYAQPSMMQPTMQQQVDPISRAFQATAGGGATMNVNGLRASLQQLGIQLSIEICNQLFQKHDSDRSGTIEINEFKNIYLEVNQWVQVFNTLDTDHSGKMEFGEFVDAMRRLNFNINEKLLPMIFKNVDNCHNGYLDLNEFIKIVSIIQVLQMKMAMYDPMHSGRITVDINGMIDIVMALPL